jgi:hypothetical protein
MTYESTFGLSWGSFSLGSVALSKALLTREKLHFFHE